MNKHLLFIISSLIFINLTYAQNNCLNFTGSDYVTINSTFGLGTTNVTLECWVSLPSTSESGTFIRAGNNDTGYGIGIGNTSFDNSGNNLIVLIDTKRWISTGATIGTGWHHVAFSIGASNQVNIYLDGKNVYTEASYGSAVLSPVSPSYIGAANTTTRILSNGKIDEARYWSAVRTEDQIKSNMYKELIGNESNLAAYYKMSDGSGSTLTDNLSSGGTNGTITGATWQTSGAFTGPKEALDFDGTNDYVSANGIDVSGTALSIETWIYPRSFNGAADANISDLVKDANENVVLRIGDGGIENNRLQFVLDFGSGQIKLNSNILLNSAQWYHVAAVYDGASMKLYINGVLDNSSSQTGTITGGSNNLLIGGNSTGRYFDGKMDEIRIWSNARTVTEISNNLIQTLAGNETGLNTYYRCDYIDGTMLYDNGSNGYNGTLTNMDGSTDWIASYAMVTAADASSSAGTSFTANWNCPGANSSFDDGYTIQYSTTSDFSSGNSTATALSSETSKSITGLTQGTTYYYRVSGKRTGSATLEYSNVKNVTTTTTIVTSNADDGGTGTLRYILTNCAEGDSITFNISAGNETITVGSEIAISKSLTINGANTSGSAIPVTVKVTTPGSGGSVYRVFNMNIASGKTVNLSNMTVKGGDLGQQFYAEVCYGGSILMKGGGNLSLESVTIDGSEAFHGGGIFCTNSSISLNNCILRNNVVNYGGLGGGLYSYSSSVLVSGSTITNNTTDFAGGGIYGESSSTLTITNCIFSNNTNTGGSGGAIGNKQSTTSITGSTISGNSASTGGGINNQQATLSILGCTISSNSASYGGGIYSTETSGVSNIFLNNCTIHSNSASSNGGGIYAYTEDMYGMGGIDLKFMITNSSISGNSCGGSGAGIYVYDDNSASTSIYQTNTIITYNAKSGAYEDIYNSNATLYGNYNINGGFALTGGNNTNYSYTNGLGSDLFSNYTEISANTIYKPVLAANGGSTETVALTTTGIAATAGVRTGSYDNSGTTYNVFYTGSNWVKVEDGATVVSSGVTAITSDQRGTTRNSSTPSIGAFDISESALPVELTSFTVNEVDGNVILKWQTTTEVNNYGFEIERLKDYGDKVIMVTIWEKIGFVQGSGNSNSQKSYSFADANPICGAVQYRLKQIDNNGLSHFSKIVEVTVDIPTEFTLNQNYPNPFNPTTTINYQLPKSGSVTLKIFDILGNEIKTLVNEQKEMGRYTVLFDASSLASGMYIYRLKVNDYISTKKMLLLK